MLRSQGIGPGADQAFITEQVGPGIAGLAGTFETDVIRSGPWLRRQWASAKEVVQPRETQVEPRGGKLARVQRFAKRSSRFDIAGAELNN